MLGSDGSVYGINRGDVAGIYLFPNSPSCIH